MLTYFRASTLITSFRILSMFKPQLILDAMDKNAKLFRRYCWDEDLK